MEEVVFYFERVIIVVRIIVGGRIFVEGFYGVLFFKIIFGIRMILEVLKCIKGEIEVINLDYLSKVDFKVLVIFFIKYFNLKMRFFLRC